jgi:hypothetical protein
MGRLLFKSFYSARGSVQVKEINVIFSGSREVKPDLVLQKDINALKKGSIDKCRPCSPSHTVNFADKKGLFL